jgi:hypothetical protein
LGERPRTCTRRKSQGPWQRCHQDQSKTTDKKWQKYIKNSGKKLQLIATIAK